LLVEKQDYEFDGGGGGARGQGCIGCWWVPQDFPYIYSWL